ncbi:MAG: mechanosensitive ion channel family protein [Gaiellales bacterium]
MSEATELQLGGLVGLLVLIWVGNWFVTRMGNRVLERLPAADQAVLATRYRLLRRITVAVIVFIAVMIVLLANDRTSKAAGAVLASSAVLGLAVGFAARSVLANFVAGIMIAINQPVRLGDRVCIGDADGVVEDIGLTYTRLRTPDNRRVLIPNEELANSRVINQTLIDPVSLAQAHISVPLTADPARVKEVLVELSALAPGRIEQRPSPIVTVSELTADRAVFTVSVWVADPASAAATSAWLRERCLARLNDEGVLAVLAGEVPG